MPRKSKPARLWLSPARADRDAVWVILDRGRQISTGRRAEDVAGAEAELARYTGQKYDPRAGQQRGLNLPISEVVAVYLREKAPKAKRADHLIYTAENALKWWGDKTLADVRERTCDDYVAWRMARGVGRSTARHDLKTLRSAINYWHAAYGPLPAVPVVTLPKRTQGRVRWLRRSEAARLLWKARRHEHIKRLILIGLYSGSRSGAIKALSWMPSTVGGWVDLEAGVIHRRAETEDDEDTKRRPIVRIHRRLLSFLRHWRAKDLDRGVGAVIHYQGRRVEKFRRSWNGIVADAGLGTYERGPRGRGTFASDVTPHVLRHTAVTWLLQAGVPVWEVAGFVGMSEKTVEEIYGHHCPDHQEKAANATNRRPKGA